MGTEVLRPHDCLARSRRPRPLRPAAGRRTAAARQGQYQGRGARGDKRSPSAAVTVPRQVVARTKVAAADAYAGPAFGAMSPSPRALPLPRWFSSRTVADDDATVPGVDDAATRELRRLLGLH
ncbi:hypothetical protein BDA96_09G140000 [Sorghum bicolor]|uniref:Uncharacterized protein n=2 Tax=Sorghum bicolor TaxID=4558 RepID=A0A921QAC5_SORBI|nr:uncharacterized protein LOC8076932 [Sorghum bicolor]KAG0518026.1 hypothetical protein BDA96_09G140000 [Sorghum bicolor]OQU77971.1 hypothetical protein SORBI_3009G133000 [Sorghum bicolor]|eukprot:XP_002439778.2 uncharacterized protein LOC8076932 [Sorghum bicolor]